MNSFDEYTIARFWSKVEVGDISACWPWKGADSKRGYGRFKINGKAESPHRIAYEIVNGKIPPLDSQYHGFVVRHMCHTPGCCNPHHLQLGTQHDNVNDRKDRTGKASIVDAPDWLGIAVEPQPFCSKLDTPKALAILRDPRTYREIAADYGISTTYVSALKNGQRWKHLHDAIHKESPTHD